MVAHESFETKAKEKSSLLIPKVVAVAHETFSLHSLRVYSPDTLLLLTFILKSPEKIM